MKRKKLAYAGIIGIGILGAALAQVALAPRYLSQTPQDYSWIIKPELPAEEYEWLGSNYYATNTRLYSKENGEMVLIQEADLSTFSDTQRCSPAHDRNYIFDKGTIIQERAISVKRTPKVIPIDTNQSIPASWKTFTFEGISFRYPRTEEADVNYRCSNSYWKQRGCVNRIFNVLKDPYACASFGWREPEFAHISLRLDVYGLGEYVGSEMSNEHYWKYDEQSNTWKYYDEGKKMTWEPDKYSNVAWEGYAMPAFSAQSETAVIIDRNNKRMLVLWGKRDDKDGVQDTMRAILSTLSIK